jgi:2-phosphoglycerate kinase
MRSELSADPKTLQEQLRHVYWIGGGSGAGKSTIARHIAAACELHVYATDDVMPDHAKRSTPESCQQLHAFMAMDMDERWVNRSPQTMLETFHWFRGEAFPLITEDLLLLPKEPAVIAEGFRLLPQLVQPLLAVQSHAVWLLPSPKFRQAVFDRRGGPQWGFIAKTSNPEQALRNLLDRDARFTERLHQEATQLGMTMIHVDPTMTVDDLAKQVMEVFGLAIR